MTLATVAFKVCTPDLSLNSKGRTLPVVSRNLYKEDVLSLYCQPYLHPLYRYTILLIMFEAHETLQTEFAVDMTCQSVSQRHHMTSQC